MNLHHITKDNCPTCGSRTRSEEADRQHCNGEWFESRTFECGCKVEYVPNFSCEKIYRQCPNSPALLAIDELRSKAVDRLLKYIKRLDVDDKYREHLVSAVKGKMYF